MRHLLLVLACACTGSISNVDVDEDDYDVVDPVDDAALLSVLRVFRDSPAFVAVSRSTYPSALDAANIDVYVSANAFAEFGSIMPERASSGVLVPEGAYIIRDVLDADGSSLRLTVMVKGPPGSNPALGDYWFGVAKPDGSAFEKAGQLPECYGCHLDRATDSYVFGVPADRR